MRSNGRAPRVLVVEDESLIAMMVEDVLEALGCRVIGPIAQLDEAQAAIDREDFDCAILDVNIRGGLIYPVAARLVERGCPILLATGYRTGSLPNSLIHEAWIAKPYSSVELELEVRRLCARALG